MQLPNRLGPLSWLYALSARPRLLVALALGAAACLLLPQFRPIAPEARVLVARNVDTVGYLLLVAQMVSGSNNEQLRRRAVHEDEGRWAVLALAVLGAAATVLAVGTP